jgi:hypothetical protein
MINLQKLYQTVQQNCHISDGLHAQDYGLCTYLLKMRELYRWEKGLPLTATLPQEDIGEWLSEREQLWDNLTEQSFHCLPIDDNCYDPFDTTVINQTLLPQGIIYGGGYGQACKPTFFIGHLFQQISREGLEVLIADHEYARDLFAPPAMTQNATIFIRRESVRRTLWERIEGWNWKKTQNHFARLLSLYNAHQDMETALDGMMADEIEIMIHHEIGEVQAGQLLGDDWEQMLMVLSGTKAEWIARAVRDHLADCLVTLPRLIAQKQTTSLLLYLANLKGMRHALFPALVEAYQAWLKNENYLEALIKVIEDGQSDWLKIAQSLLACYHTDPNNSATLIIEKMKPFNIG